MKKKSFWQRCNRGFIVSLVLLAGVIVYVAAGQIALGAEKRRVRQVTDELQAVAVETMELSLDECRQMTADPKKAAAAAADFQTRLQPFFTEDSAYLKEAANFYAVMIQDRVSNELDIRKLNDPQEEINEVAIVEDTATVYLSTRYTTVGSQLVYNGKDGVTEKSQMTVVTDMSVSLALVDGEWKVYRVNTLSSYLDDGSRAQSVF
ncbi:MAG: hypothetical protein ACOYJY_01400 [Acutalibacteraceae bacterium]